MYLRSIKIINHEHENKEIKYIKNEKILVNNNWYIQNLVYLSSFQSGRNELVKLTKKQIQNTVNVNFTFCVLLIREILNKRPNKPGSFILFGTQATILGGNEISIYASTKGAIEVLTKSIAREVGKYNLRVNCISPASINTTTLINQDKAIIKNIIDRIPLGRLGKAQEVVDLIMWLLSNTSSYITGAIIPITGGK